MIPHCECVCLTVGPLSRQQIWRDLQTVSATHAGVGGEKELLRRRAAEGNWGFHSKVEDPLC